MQTNESTVELVVLVVVDGEPIDGWRIEPEDLAELVDNPDTSSRWWPSGSEVAPEPN